MSCNQSLVERVKFEQCDLSISLNRANATSMPPIERDGHTILISLWHLIINFKSKYGSVVDKITVLEKSKRPLDQMTCS